MKTSETVYAKICYNINVSLILSVDVIYTTKLIRYDCACFFISFNTSIIYDFVVHSIPHRRHVVTCLGLNKAKTFVDKISWPDRSFHGTKKHVTPWKFKSLPFKKMM